MDLSKIEQLYERYKDSDYIIQRLNNHIQNLPFIIENEANNYEKRQNMNAHLSEEHHIFMQVFLSKHKYYYLANNNCYYEYNGVDYLIVKEDFIIHKLLSTISKDKVLLPWKYKTKINVLKQIKDRHLFSCIPESTTIQHVLNALTPCFFPTKQFAKYFLTVIGDNMLKKNSDLIFIISPKLKQFVDELEFIASVSVGHNNISQKMITKYHDNHGFNNCRLVHLNDSFSNELWRETLKKIGLNLLCVCVHYSNRYNSSDLFVANSLDEELTKHVFMLKNTSQSELIKTFMSEYLETTSIDFRIEWRNLHFIWKQFLCSNRLPNVVYSNSLKSILKGLLTYDEESDSFIGITSKYLPMCKDFIQFWNETMTVQHGPSEFETNLEIDEISQLFKQWTKKGNLSEDVIIKILMHFFAINVVDNKFVFNVTSSNWNKINEIEQSVSYIKEQIQDSSYLALIHMDDLYNYYYKYCVKKSLKLIVNKGYFEKYLQYKYAPHICYDKFIKSAVFYD